MIAQGIPIPGVLQQLSETFGKIATLPRAIVKYLWCSPSFDLTLRCLPAAGGLYAQRYRDFVEFNIIENRLRNISGRRR